MAILLATSSPYLRQRWAEALAGYGPVAVDDAGQLGRQLAEQESAIPLVLDLAWPDAPRTDAGWQHISRHSRPLALADAPLDQQGLHLFGLGIRGYGHTLSPAATLCLMVDTILNDGVWVGATLMAQLIGSLSRVMPGTSRSEGWRDPLSVREQEVVEKLLTGASNKLIAREMGISERTVKAHLSAVFEKLGVTDRLQLLLKVRS
ncbi:response regulator transcription factor [Pseudogulbenkiania sp. MAI-1]|uniref:helix-turn-helix transcriptional regulator n=1 Tax=Pseudogulbenkiania sp. MAI-1 TaxID=990370 RepID=UPI00045EAA52|nr:response regulator transcription factor [Pseudogulbenkiania sp. MAI-1]